MPNSSSGMIRRESTANSSAASTPQTIGTNRQHFKKLAHLPLGAPPISQVYGTTDSVQFLRVR